MSPKILKIIFCGYWLIVFIGLIPWQFQNATQSNFVLAHFFPKHYRMYVKPTQSLVAVEYKYYAKGKLVERLNSSDFMKQKIGKDKVFSVWLTKYLLYFNAYQQLDYAYLNWHYNKKTARLQKNVLPFDSVIVKDDYLNRYVSNAIVFGVDYCKEKGFAVDSFQMEIHRKPILLNGYISQENLLSQQVGHQIICSKTKILP